MYQGNQPTVGRYSKVEDISSSFNSVLTTFPLTVSGLPAYPGTDQNILISLDGVLQEPGSSYTISGSSVIFSEPVPTSTTFFGVILGSVLSVGVPTDGTVDSSKMTSLAHVDFVQTSTSSPGTGRVKWNDVDGTLDIGMKGGSVTLQVGQEQFIRVVNKTGAVLTNGRAVQITGAVGNRVTVAYAANASESLSANTVGILTETIPVDGEGYVTTSGLVRNLNTSAFLEGSAIWLDSASGNFTTTKPVAPGHTVLLGFIVSQHALTGSIFVNVANGHEVDELHDVLIDGKTSGDVLQYDSVSGLWKNVQKGLGADNIFNGWLSKDIGSVVLDKGTISTGTVTFNYMDGSCQRLQVGGTLTLGLSNFPPSGNLGVLQIELVNGGSSTVTFPAINWLLKNGTFTTSIATYLTDSGRNALQTSGIDFVMLWSRNGGSTVYGKIL